MTVGTVFLGASLSNHLQLFGAIISPSQNLLCLTIWPVIAGLCLKYLSRLVCSDLTTTTYHEPVHVLKKRPFVQCSISIARTAPLPQMRGREGARTDRSSALEGIHKIHLRDHFLLCLVLSSRPSFLEDCKSSPIRIKVSRISEGWTATGFFLVPVFLLIVLWERSRRRGSNLPPSPAGLPLIGHLHLIPKSHSWIWYHQLAQEFKSPLTYLNMGGQDVIIVNEYQAAIDILDKRSAVYSSRPYLVVSDKYASMNKRMSLMPYGDAWRGQRYAFHHHMTAQKCTSFIPIQSAETKLLIQDLLRTPTAFMKNFAKYSSNIILRICYGLDSEEALEKATHDVEMILEMFLESTVAGAYLVDSLPWLDRLPDFLSPWRPGALRQRKLTRDLYVGLLQQVLKSVVNGKLQPENAITARLWNSKEKFRMDELDVAFLAGLMFEAGMDTTAATLDSFVLALVTYPHTLIEAQTEMDTICEDRAPTMDDIDRLPYVRAMCKEIMRWRPVAPNGIPHLATTTEDDYYKGMRIPAGALLIPNQYGMGLSQEMYGQKYDAEIFEPRRWIDRPQGVGDIFQDNPGFGFGRRICPGKYLAMQSLFLAVSNVCYWFDIKPKDGVSLDIHKYTSGLTMQPQPFDCDITPRAGREAEIETEAAIAQELLASIFGRGDFRIPVHVRKAHM